MPVGAHACRWEMDAFLGDPISNFPAKISRNLRRPRENLPKSTTFPRKSPETSDVGRLSKYDTVLYVRLALCWTAKNCTAKAWRTGLRHCLVLATATPTLAALRPAHDHARAEHTQHARTTRARLASDAHAFTLQQALARQKQGWHARVTGHWLTVGLPTACASGSHTRCKCARPPPPLLVRRMRHSHAVHAMHHHRCHVPTTVALQRHNFRSRQKASGGPQPPPRPPKNTVSSKLWQDGKVEEYLERFSGSCDLTCCVG